MKRTIKDYLLILSKGVAMGTADVIPGVSGGTIAFITGIYEELIHSIKSIDIEALKLFFSGKWKAFWKHINGSFLLSLFLGIALAVLSLARILEHLLDNYPVHIWAFFFGLVLISAYVVARRVKEWNYPLVISLVFGIGAAFYVTSITPSETTEAVWFVILSGILASCAMILPGISGSFILLLLGKYAFALTAINELDLQAILLLGLGAVIGLLSLSRLLSWLFKTYHDVTVAVLAGFMIGSLNKIWPWKETLEEIIVDGESKPLIQKNILPQAANPDHYLLGAILLILTGIGLIVLFEFGFKKKKEKATEE